MPDISQKQQTDGFTRRKKHKWFDKNRVPTAHSSASTQQQVQARQDGAMEYRSGDPDTWGFFPTVGSSPSPPPTP